MGGYFSPPPYEGDNLGALMQQRAQIQARGAEQSGQIWGNALQNVGQIAAQGIQQWGEARDQKKIQGAVSAGMANPDDFESVLSSLDPTQAAKARKAFADANDAASKLDERRSLIAQHEAALAKAHQDYQQQTADYAGTVALRTLPFLDDDPAGGIGAISLALAHAKSRGVPGADQYDDQLAQAQDLIKKAQATGDPMALPVAGEKIRQTFKPILEQMTLGMSPETKAKLLGEEPKGIALSDNQRLVDPRTGKVMVGGTPRQETRSLDVQAASALAAGDTATYNRLLKVKKEMGQADDRPRVTVSMAGGGGGVQLTDKALDVLALKYKRTGERPPVSLRDSDTMKRIENRASELTADDEKRIVAGGLDLAFNKSDLAADSASLKAIQKQTDAVSAFERTADKNSALLEDRIKDLPDTGVRFLNSPVRSIAGQFGSTEVAAVNAIRQSVQNEYGRILSNPGLSGTMSDSARKEAEAILSGDLTVAQTLEAVKVLRQEAANRHSSYQEQIDQIRGRRAGSQGQAPALPRPSNIPSTPPLGYRNNGYHYVGGPVASPSSWAKD